MMTRDLIVGRDPVARVVIGDTPYVRVQLDDIHDPVEVGIATDSPQSLASGKMLSLPDRTLTPEAARASRVPTVAVVYDAAVADQPYEQSQEMPAGDDVLRLPLGGPDGFGLAGIVSMSRNARLVRVDRSNFQSDAHFAQVVLAMSGSGTVVQVPDSARLHEFLQPDLIQALVVDAQAVLTDELVWGTVSARLRRLAWHHHDLRLTTDGHDWRLVPRALPSISVLLATNRPSYVTPALEQVARQTHTDVEVIVALHGVSGAADDARRQMKRLGVDGAVLELPAAMPLGQVLNSSAACSTGHVVTKWDDDDLYGPDHLVDMCVGLRYSKAALVGKAPEFIHFTQGNTTILRNHSGFETFSDVIAGGTMTMPRVVFDDVGGFPPVPRAVDHYLKRQLLDSGMPIYRMHGFGFALVRHADGHTWALSDAELAVGAQRSWAGLPDIAGVGRP